MTVSTDPYYHWSSRSDWNTPPFNDCSPNLRSILGYLTRHFGGKTLGCHNDRTVAGSSTMSSHAWGAALDYLPDGGNVVLTAQVAPFLIQWSKELGINTIHDYVHQLMWKPNGGWVHASIGSAGGQWGHIETTPAMWGETRSVEDRISGTPHLPPGPGYNPANHDYGLYPLNKNKPSLGPGFGYTNGTQQYQGYCQYANDVMMMEAGQLEQLKPGMQDQTKRIQVVWTIYSMAACMNVQQFFGLPVNGWVPKETWDVLDALASNFGRPR